MRSILLIMLAGCAVKCDDSSYYVIEVPTEKELRPFSVYWNVPTMQCRSKRVHFENLYEDFGIIQNGDDSFRGEKISILYDPGDFPAVFKNESSGSFRFRNGGVPQEGDLNKHLSAFRAILEQSVPDPNFNGIGVIDFESWRPIFRQNFGVLTPYKEISYQIERKRHKFWPEREIKALAAERFEKAARSFMEASLKLATSLRPKATWGYYAFPYCFNKDTEVCARRIPEENDKLRWLWSLSGSVHPSVYVSAGVGAAGAGRAAGGRVREAARTAPRALLLPYFWYRYREEGFLEENVLHAIIESIYKSKADGLVIWGSSNDVNTVEKCRDLLKYTKETLGPTIAKYTKQRQHRNPDNTNQGTTDNIVNGGTTWFPGLKDETNQVIVNPDYYWDPPANYSQIISDNVDNILDIDNKSEKVSLLELLYYLLTGKKHNINKVFSIEVTDSKNDSQIYLKDNILKTDIYMDNTTNNPIINILKTSSVASITNVEYTSQRSTTLNADNGEFDYTKNDQSPDPKQTDKSIEKSIDNQPMDTENKLKAKIDLNNVKIRYFEETKTDNNDKYGFTQTERDIQTDLTTEPEIHTTKLKYRPTIDYTRVTTDKDYTTTEYVTENPKDEYENTNSNYLSEERFSSTYSTYTITEPTNERDETTTNRDYDTYSEIENEVISSTDSVTELTANFDSTPFNDSKELNKDMEMKINNTNRHHKPRLWERLTTKTISSLLSAESENQSNTYDWNETDANNSKENSVSNSAGKAKFF